MNILAYPVDSGSAYPPSVQSGIPRLGRTPSGWQKVRLGDVLRPVSRPVKLSRNEQYQLVTAKRNRGGIVSRQVLYGRQIRTKSQFRIEAGDFLISRRQIAHGACGLVPKELHGAIVSNEYATLRTCEGLSPRFLNHLAHSTYFQQTCFHSSIGVHVEKLVFKLQHWLDWNILLPPIEQQEKIADILDAWDNALKTAEALISAKRRWSSWLHGELFPRSPQSLLDGWQTAPLSDLATVRFSSVDKKVVAGERPVRLCNYMEVFHNRRITADLPFMPATANDNEIESFALRVGDVVFTKDSETPEEIAESAVVADELDNVLCGYHLAIARPQQDIVTGEFLALSMRHPQVRKALTRCANGATRFGLTLDSVNEVSILYPRPERQEMIVGALRNLEMEMTNLNRMLVSLRMQRRGLLRKLMAGEWPYLAAEQSDILR